MVKYWSADDLARYADKSTKPARLQPMIENMKKVLDWKIENPFISTEKDINSAVIVGDTETSPFVVHTMSGVLQTKGIEPTAVTIPQMDAPNNEPPAEAAAAISETDLLINVCSHTITHSEVVEEATKKRDDPINYIILSGAEEDTFLTGAVDADPEEHHKFTSRVQEIYDEGEWVEVTSPHGTDVEFSVEDRPIHHVSFPWGEAGTCPVEETIDGTIVHDSFMMGVGILDDPIIWEVEDGYIQEIKGGREAKVLSQYVDEHGDENAYWIGEAAIMTNPKARPNGGYSENKQVGGGMHFAMGTGTYCGGKYRSSIHLDGVQLEPTVEIDGEVILEEGEFTI